MFEFSYGVKEVLERFKTDIYDRGTDDRFNLGSPGDPRSNFKEVYGSS